MDEFDSLSMTKFNDFAADWGRMTRNRYRYWLQTLPFKERTKYRKDETLRTGTSLRLVRQHGDIVRIGWQFARHGVFQELGVGRGRKKGSGKEKPMPWMVKTLDEMTPQLADALQDEGVHLLGLVVNIKVNGLFEIALD